MKQIVKVGVLALQGGFIEHVKMLQSLNVEIFEIRTKTDMQQAMDGLIIPGGESTTVGKLLRDLDICEVLKNRIVSGLPVFGTCAGMILLAKRISGSSTAHLGLMDITVKRNAYGRQLGSFFANAAFEDVGTVPMTFIRAPYIEKIGPKVEALAEVDGHIVAAREKRMLVTSFHSELTNDNRIHRYFIEQIIQYS